MTTLRLRWGFEHARSLQFLEHLGTIAQQIWGSEEPTSTPSMPKEPVAQNADQLRSMMGQFFGPR